MYARALFPKFVAALAIAATSSPVVAADIAAAGSFVCREIAPTIEHARIVRLPSSDGIEPFVKAELGRGACRVFLTETPVTVVDVDQRGFALIEENQQKGQWWIDAESIWGYFETPAKVKAWKKL